MKHTILVVDEDGTLDTMSYHLKKIFNKSEYNICYVCADEIVQCDPYDVYITIAKDLKSIRDFVSDFKFYIGEQTSELVNQDVYIYDNESQVLEALQFYMQNA